MKPSPDEILLLRFPNFIGPKPGSNFWTVLDVSMDDGSVVGGEHVEACVRKGWMVARPYGKVLDPLHPDAELEMPDIELDHEYFVTPAGLAALKEFGDG